MGVGSGVDEYLKINAAADDAHDCLFRADWKRQSCQVHGRTFGRWIAVL